ncbi:MAG: Holliday junction branch migration protein RuvA [Clostridia bacterium]|nr:Holliday junction branch migration protein RuvA [Clostridia bacterium]
MYYYIKGTLAARGANHIVVDAGGVGYMIFTPSPEKAPQQGSIVTVYTYLNVREDAMELYGFLTEEEKRLFMQLISVSGVGPKVGLALLSAASAQSIMTAIITGDTKTLTRAQGVGPKAAKRIILELKDKLDPAELGIDGDEGIITEDADAPIMDARAEALSALVVLGYSANDAKNALMKLDASMSTEELIKKALAKLM